MRPYSTIGSITASLVVMACTNEPPASSEPMLDAEAVNLRFDVMNAVLESETWQSFGVLGLRIADAPPVGPGMLGTPADVGSGAGATATALVPRIPQTLRGTTFVLDPETLRYIVDPDRPGAPENGVRFILYAVNQVTREPLLDTEIGHADLTDEGDELPSGVSLRLEVVSGEDTFVDYLVTTDGDETSGTLTVTGFISDVEHRIEFDIDAANTQDIDGASMDLGFDIAVPGSDFSAFAEAHNVHALTGNAGRVSVTIETADVQVMFDAEGTPQTIDAEVRVDGRLFATIRGPHASPTIRGADGRALSPPERRMLQHIVALNGHVFEMFGNLMRPASSLLGLELLPGQ